MCQNDLSDSFYCFLAVMHAQVLLTGDCVNYDPQLTT